jgi:hypothetical protein
MAGQGVPSAAAQQGCGEIGRGAGALGAADICPRLPCITEAIVMNTAEAASPSTSGSRVVLGRYRGPAFVSLNLLDFTTGLAFDWFVANRSATTVYGRLRFPGVPPAAGEDPERPRYFCLFNQPAAVLTAPGEQGSVSLFGQGVIAEYTEVVIEGAAEVAPVMAAGASPLRG